MAQARIIEGKFALVGAGNCSRLWMVDGDDIQARADKALGPYWSNEYSLSAEVFERGYNGFGVCIDQAHMLSVHGTREHAERARDYANNALAK